VAPKIGAIAIRKGPKMGIFDCECVTCPPLLENNLIE